MSSRVPGATRSGSSMPLTAASPRHRAGSSYSRKATEWRLSPAAITWLRRPAIAPEVGFVFGGSVGISSREIWALALTDLRKPLNSARGCWPPQRNWSASGCGFFFWLMDLSVGLSQPSSVSMSLTRSPLPSQSSKNSSIWTVWGWTPPNSGAVACLALLEVGRFQVADLLIEYSFGLKRNSSLEPSSAASVALGIRSYPASRKPLCASSRVSLATWLPAASSVGPVHFTGHTPLRFHRQTTWPFPSSTAISAVCRSTLLTIPETHFTTVCESRSRGRVSLTFGYLRLPGSRCT